MRGERIWLVHDEGHANLILGKVGVMALAVLVVLIILPCVVASNIY